MKETNYKVFIEFYDHTNYNSEEDNATIARYEYTDNPAKKLELNAFTRSRNEHQYDHVACVLYKNTTLITKSSKLDVAQYRLNQGTTCPLSAYKANIDNKKFEIRCCSIQIESRNNLST